MTLLAGNWLNACQDGETDAGIADIHPDCQIDFLDYAKVAKGWGECLWRCE
jgi:hypothetical protein